MDEGRGWEERAHARDTEEFFVKMLTDVRQRTEKAAMPNWRLGRSIDCVRSEGQRWACTLSEFRDEKPSPTGDVSPIGSI